MTSELLEIAEKMRNAPTGFPSLLSELDFRPTSMDKDMHSYFAAGIPTDSFHVNDVTWLGRQELPTQANDLLPGFVVKSINLVPIAVEPTGDTYCGSIVTGRVYLIPYLWTDDADPDHFQAYYSDSSRMEVPRESLTEDTLLHRERDTTVISSFITFLLNIEEATR